MGCTLTLHIRRQYREKGDFIPSSDLRVPLNWRSQRPGSNVLRLAKFDGFKWHCPLSFTYGHDDLLPAVPTVSQPEFDQGNPAGGFLKLS